MHPGQRNSLDALCRRYEVDNSGRDLHGALLDAEILADVYLAMTGGQTALALEGATQPNKISDSGKTRFTADVDFPVIRADKKELKEHQRWLDLLGPDTPSGEMDQAKNESKH